MTTYGYARDTGSPLATAYFFRLRRALEAVGCTEIFSEVDVRSTGMPGPEFRRLVDMVQRGDKVVIPDATRLTRKPETLDFIVGALNDLGVGVEFLQAHWMI
ncbi:recombinase family protein [Amycolatopsis halotolerans]|uniref:Recombinase family protein n=1 Tax=Amycolatopsis halotolerans TaxID=330083 RepID=A0ABV7QU96_9PSEU